jgi:uncharacterized membrane protein YedE/YeeE
MERAMPADVIERETVETHVDAPVRVAALAPYFVIGTVFGIVLTKGEAVSWFRIQEMFRFGAFHMYGIIASAVLVAAAGITALRGRHRHALNGERIALRPKTGFHRYWIGGSIFGVGWALTGACPGPLFVLVGNGVTVMLVAIASALAGTWAYGAVRRRLPH